MDHLRGRDPVPEVVDIGRVLLELEVLDAVAERASALSSAPPEMFQTSRRPSCRTLPVIPGRQTTMSRIAFLGTRPPFRLGQPTVNGVLLLERIVRLTPTLKYSGCCVPGICDLIASRNGE